MEHKLVCWLPSPSNRASWWLSGKEFANTGDAVQSWVNGRASGERKSATLSILAGQSMDRGAW